MAPLVGLTQLLVTLLINCQLRKCKTGDNGLARNKTTCFVMFCSWLLRMWTNEPGLEFNYASQKIFGSIIIFLIKCIWKYWQEISSRVTTIVGIVGPNFLQLNFPHRNRTSLRPPVEADYVGTGSLVARDVGQEERRGGRSPVTAS